MRRRNDQGFVLVCVLWVLAILTVITIGFGRRAYMDRAAATYTFDHAKAMQMARGAVSKGIIELQNKAVYDLINKQGGYTGYSQQWAKEHDLLKEEPGFAPDEKEGSGGNSSGSGGDGNETEKDICAYVIKDEAGLINVNAAPEEMLGNIKGLSRTTIRKIMARRDPTLDESSKAEGPTRTGFQTIEEVHALEGVSEEEWYGTERRAGLKEILTAWNYVAQQPEEDPTSISSSVSQVYSNGNQWMINVNTASKAVLKAIPDLQGNVIDAIVHYRAGGDGELFTGDDQDFRTLDEVADKAGIGGDSLQPLRSFCTTQSNLFTITGTATRRHGKIRATCVATIAITGASADVYKWREELLEP